MMNASMEFDEKSSLPTYKVLEGIPGDSHAIQAAIRAKMPKEITREASASSSTEWVPSVSVVFTVRLLLLLQLKVTVPFLPEVFLTYTVALVVLLSVPPQEFLAV